MRRHYFYKAGTTPMWIHVPGTPITLPGEQTKYERLPGMTDWAPRGVVSRVGQGLAQDQSMDDIAEAEATRGLGGRAAAGAGTGLLAGAASARLAGGEAVAAPFKNILKRGINAESLRGLRKLPMKAGLLPLLGIGIGAATGVGSWAAGRDARRAQAKSVGKGLLSEQILQQHAIGQARQGEQTRQLTKLPIESASMPSPKATVLSSSGV